MTDTVPADNTTNANKKRRRRSPAYPAIGLEQAIDRARTIYQEEGQVPVLAAAVYVDWGYKSESGPSKSALSALRKYGLVDYQGSGEDRKVLLTDRAMDILLRESGDPVRRNSVREAALAPTIHTEIRKKYPDRLPSDTQLSMELQRERGFTEVAVADFIPRMKATFAFAGLTGADTIQDDEAQTEEDMTSTATATRTETRQPPSSRSSLPGTRTISLPIDSNTWAVLEAAFPLSEDGWDQMIAVLQAMKPALVKASNDLYVSTEVEDDPDED